MPATTRKLRVFLCHASQDKPVVRELYQRLLAEDWIDPWLDEEKLLPGQDWDIEIEKAVEESDTVIVCFSSNSITKEGYIQRELKYILYMALTKPEETIYVIPVRLDNCEIPRRLRSWHCEDYFPTSRRDAAFYRLILSLKIRARTNGLLPTEDVRGVPFADAKQIIEMIDTVDEEVSRIQERLSGITKASQAQDILEEIKVRIDICLEINTKDDIPFYTLFRAYCHLVLGNVDNATNSTIHAIDGFRKLGMAMQEVFGHWFLALIYRTQKREYLFLAEVNQALAIIEPVRQNYLIRGEYDSASRCSEIQNSLEAAKERASRIGTGPLFMPEKKQ